MIIARSYSQNGETVLRQGASGYEIISDGQFLISSGSAPSSIALIELGLAALPSKEKLQLLIAGLGLGFSVKTALNDHRVRQVVVVELESAIIDWHRRGLIPETKGILDDPKVKACQCDFLNYLDQCQDRYDLITIDIDNGPGWLSHSENWRLYSKPYLLRLRNCLKRGGVLAFWSAEAAPVLQHDLAELVSVVDEQVVFDDNGAGESILAYIYLAGANKFLRREF